MWTLGTIPLGTIPLDGSTGWALASAELGTGMADSAVITSVADWDNTSPSYGDWLALKQNDVTVLYGYVSAVEPYAEGGGAQGRKITLSNAWKLLEETIYKQAFKYRTGFSTLETKWRTKVWLGSKPDGTRATTLEAIRDVIDYATDQAGISMALSIAGFGVYAPVTEATDQTCAALIMQQLRWHPNVLTFWRYTATSGTLHIKPLSALAEKTVKVSNAPITDPQPISASVKPRADIVPPCVMVKYERINEFTEGDETIQSIEIHEDKAGGGSEHAPGALIYTIELAGLKSTAVVQPIRARTVPDEFANDDDPATPDDATMTKTAKWYRSHIVVLKYFDLANIRVDEHLKSFEINEVTEDLPDPDDAPPVAPTGDPADYHRELLEGSVQEWMSGVKATPMVARGIIGWRGAAPTDPAVLKLARNTFGKDLDQTVTYDVRYTGTNAVTQRYRSIGSFVGVEDWPTGLAAAVYESISTLRHEGTITLRDNNVPLTVLPGDFVILDGQAGSGPVQKVSIDGNGKRAGISFGWPGHLAPADFRELSRASRLNSLSPSSSPERRTAASPKGAVGAAVSGPLRGPTSNPQPQPPKPAPPLPFTLIDEESEGIRCLSSELNDEVPDFTDASSTGFSTDDSPPCLFMPTAAGLLYAHVQFDAMTGLETTRELKVAATLPDDDVTNVHKQIGSWGYVDGKVTDVKNDCYGPLELRREPPNPPVVGKKQLQSDAGEYTWEPVPCSETGSEVACCTAAEITAGAIKKCNGETWLPPDFACLDDILDAMCPPPESGDWVWTSSGGVMGWVELENCT